MSKTIGIIGGSGPLASMDIEKKVFDIVKHKFSRPEDKNYPQLLIYQHTNFSTDTLEREKQYISCAKILENAGVSNILIACHSAHIYLKKIKSEIRTEVTDIVQLTSDYLHNIYPNINKVGLLSTYTTLDSKLYNNALSQYNIEVIGPEEKSLMNLLEGIHLIKAGILYDKVVEKKFLADKYVSLFSAAMEELIYKGCEYIILGCTELPLIFFSLQTLYPKSTLIDSNMLIAKFIINQFYQANEHQNLN
ncbi:Putative amino-acid racemase (plasmid) [Candidatus Trichorickettsia mobilis]|uniref:aspartate/glutamate racemase family protein n=1 Tax=Candidatus Trichorickettsia mobilis TaxID=1346319 RepID=UPI002B258344|nr:amino acid racemase [Candidatus Trichorickettsia mobilis]WPY01801.1 Putative amino-acid racemase [Candidatus Trichorickettsia mobilis]